MNARAVSTDALLGAAGLGDIGDLALAEIAVELDGITLRWQHEVRPYPLTIDEVVAGDEEVEPAVVVVVPKPGRKAPLGLLDTKLRGDLFERAVTPVMVKEVVLSIV